MMQFQITYEGFGNELVLILHQQFLILLSLIQQLIQFFMQNQNTRSSIRSSFHKKRYNELANYLVKQMGMDVELAHLFIRIHGPTNITQTLSLFLIDQNGAINHAFIPQEDYPEICRVCESLSAQHREINIDQVNEQIQREREDLSSQIALLDEQEVPQSRHTCEICYIQFAKSDMLQIKDEMHNICLQCMGSYIREEISNMRVEKISCPHCGVLLAQDLIRDLTDVSTFNKYKLFIRNLEIQKSPNLKWCPNSKCSVVVSTNPNKKTSKCPKCATEICNKCNREAHPRSSCEGAFRKQIQDWQNASDIQKCKKCQGLVQKIAGCNHMTCSICHFQWCWLCGSDYSTAHFSALNPFGCPGLQDRPRDDWGKCKILLLRIGLLFLFIIGVPVILPVAMIACGPVLIGNVFWNCLYPQGFCKKFWIIIVSIILGILANPIVWIGCLVYFIPKGIQKLYYWYIQRKQNEQRRANFLQERLLGEEVYQERSLANQ